VMRFEKENYVKEKHRGEPVVWKKMKKEG
jgi:hypothetical protein